MSISLSNWLHGRINKPWTDRFFSVLVPVRESVLREGTVSNFNRKSIEGILDGDLLQIFLPRRQVVS